MEAVIPSRAERELLFVSANSSRWHIHFWKWFSCLSNRSMGCGGKGAETGRNGQNKCCSGDGEIHLITCEFLCIWCSAWGLTTPWRQEIHLWHPGKELCKAAWLPETETALALRASCYFSQNTPVFTRWALQVIQLLCTEDSTATVVSSCLSFAFRRSRMLFLEVTGLAVLPAVESRSLSVVWLREISCEMQTLVTSLKWKYPGCLAALFQACMFVLPARQPLGKARSTGGLEHPLSLTRRLSRSKCSGLFKFSLCNAVPAKSISPPLFSLLLARRDQSLPSGKYMAKIKKNMN